MSHPIITRAEAKAQGLKKYFSGVACHKGHLSERYVTGAMCLECRDSDKPKYAAHRRASRQKPNGKRATFKANLKYKYGLTVEAYNAKLEAQENRCACCNFTFDTSSKFTSPYIDHNHETGKVRDLLCNHCNSGIGMAKEDTSLLRTWIQYLRRHNVTA